MSKNPVLFDIEAHSPSSVSKVVEKRTVSVILPPDPTYPVMIGIMGNGVQFAVEIERDQLEKFKTELSDYLKTASVEDNTGT